MRRRETYVHQPDDRDELLPRHGDVQLEEGHGLRVLGEPVVSRLDMFRLCLEQACDVQAGLREVHMSQLAEARSPSGSDHVAE